MRRSILHSASRPQRRKTNRSSTPAFAAAVHSPPLHHTIRVTLSIRVTAALLAAAPSILAAQTAAPPPIAEQIAAAVQPLPADMRAAATVMGYKTGTKLEVIRPGTNGMRCLALYVTRPNFHVACYH